MTTTAPGSPLSGDALRMLRLDALGLRVPAAVPRSQTEVVEDLAAVGRHFLAMQGQDFPAVRWALGQRVPGATHSDVRAVFDAGQLLRSWPMRGTLHVVPGEDIGWIQSLTNERMTGVSAQRRREQLGLELATIERAREVSLEVLAGRRALSREQLMAVWLERIPAMRAEWNYHVVWFLAQTGTLCQGPMLDDREQALVLVDDWVPEQRQLGREEALTELALRYVRAHGAVSMKDFVWWTGLPQRDLKLGIAGAGGAITSRAGDDDVAYFIAAESAEGADSTARDDADMAADALPHVLLLPAFDEYLLGYGNRSLMLAPAHAEQVCPGKNGVFRPTVVIDGVMLGWWKREPARVKDAGMRLTITPFDAAAAKRLRSRPVKAPLAAAAREYARFLLSPSGTQPDGGPPVEVTIAVL